LSLQIDHAKAAALEREFDADMQFRPLGVGGNWIVVALLLALSVFHFYTAASRPTAAFTWPSSWG
jgi:TRAP-type uncharacterized transport system fused permease subunit